MVDRLQHALLDRLSMIRQALSSLIYMSSYCYLCPHTAICFLILLFIFFTHSHTLTLTHTHSHTHSHSHTHTHTHQGIDSLRLARTRITSRESGQWGRFEEDEERLEHHVRAQIRAAETIVMEQGALLRRELALHAMPPAVSGGGGGLRAGALGLHATAISASPIATTLGAQVTCFISTKVQILTQKALLAPLRLALLLYLLY